MNTEDHSKSMMPGCGKLAYKIATVLGVAMAVGLAVSGCQSQPVAESPAVNPQPVSQPALQGASRVGPQDADKLLVVDCLLPGAVRKLGNMTYLSPRRPIRTVASECEIRGGEYTVYDRADARTARLVWLPKAQEGDAQAQVYLGEIYEKGLGVPPDYKVAAGWYRKAALQGDTRGAINLGYLYEKGLGVEKNLVEALNWYRKASGLESGDLEFASNIQATERKLDELQQQLTYSRQEADALRQRMQSSRKQIRSRESALRKSEREVAALRKKVASGEPAKARPLVVGSIDKGASQNTQELKRLRRELDAQRGEVRRQREEAQRLQADFDRETGQLLAELAQSRDEKASLAASLESNRRELEQLRGKLDTSHSALEADRKALARERAGFESSLQAMEELQRRLIAKEQQQSAAGVSAKTQAQDLRRELQRKETELAAQRSRIAGLEQQLEQGKVVLAEAEQRQTRLQSSLGEQDAQSARLRQQLAEARWMLNDTSDRLNAQNTRVQEAVSELQRLGQELNGRQQSQTASEAELAGLRSRLDKQQQQAQRERAEQARLQKDMAQRQAALAAEIEDLKKRERDLSGALEDRIAQSEASNRQLADASSRLQDSEQRLAALSTQLTKMQEDSARRDAAFAQQSAQDQASIQTLEGELQSKEQALQREREELAKLKSANADYRKQLAAVEGESKKLASVGPSIEILDPPIALTRSGELTVQLRSATRERVIVGKVTAPAGLLSLTVNDRSEKPDEYDVFRSTIPVAEQKTPVTVMAVDKRGKRASIDFSLIPKMRLADARKAEPREDTQQPRFDDIDFGNYHALIIGNNDYPNFPDLESAINDARRLDGLLREQYGFNTTLLINANRYQILSALNELRAKLTPEDNLLIYYAGHGELDRVNLRGHWIPVDAEPDNTANWISNIAITDILNVIAAKHVLVVADSCYSGALTRSSMARISPQTTSETRYKWMKVMNKTRSRTVLTSGGLKPVLDTGRGGHSVFAGAFLKVLQDNNDVLDGYKLFRGLVDDVRDAAARFQVEQEPLYAPIKYAGHEAGEFFFVPKSARL